MISNSASKYNENIDEDTIDQFRLTAPLYKRIEPGNGDPQYVNKLSREILWIPLFFYEKYSALSKILWSSGCREKWLHGEIYLERNNKNLEIDKMPKPFSTKMYDIYQPKIVNKEGVVEDGFIIEIKIRGGTYQSSAVKDCLDDIKKLTNINGDMKVQYTDFERNKSSYITKNKKRIPDNLRDSTKLVEFKDSFEQLNKYFLLVLVNDDYEEIQYDNLFDLNPSKPYDKYEYKGFESENVFYHNYGDFCILVWRVY